MRPQNQTSSNQNHIQQFFAFSENKVIQKNVQTKTKKLPYQMPQQLAR